MNSSSDTTSNAILLTSCPDQRGLIAAFSSFLHKYNGNIVDLEQHVDTSEGRFFMRLEWSLAGFELTRQALPKAVGALAQSYGMDWSLHFTDEVPRMAVLVSRQSHCLLDILARIQSRELAVELPLVVSNHEDCRLFVEGMGIEYRQLPVTAANKTRQEASLVELLESQKIEFVVLARYMQILSAGFVAHFANRIINIHHSFLPAFPGARPYHLAHERGVKIIGATSHYVTAELDAGPIIEQDVVRVSHSDSVTDMMHKGRDLEKLVLARAIHKHVQRKVLVSGNRTLVFT